MIFRLLMKGKFDFYLQWPFGEKSTVCHFTVKTQSDRESPDCVSIAWWEQNCCPASVTGGSHIIHSVWYLFKNCQFFNFQVSNFLVCQSVVCTCSKVSNFCKNLKIGMNKIKKKNKEIPHTFKKSAFSKHLFFSHI